MLTRVTSPFLAPSSCDNELVGVQREAHSDVYRTYGRQRSKRGWPRDREMVLVPSCRPRGVRHGTEKTFLFREAPFILRSFFVSTLWLEARKEGCRGMWEKQATSRNDRAEYKERNERGSISGCLRDGLACEGKKPPARVFLVF